MHYMIKAIFIDDRERYVKIVGSYPNEEVEFTRLWLTGTKWFSYDSAEYYINAVLQSEGVTDVQIIETF